MNRTFTGDGLGAFKTSVNRTIMVRLTFLFFYLAPLSFSSFIIRTSPLLLLSPLIFLWACDGVGGVFGLVGSGLYLRCPCLLSGGVLVGKSPTLFQVRVSLSGLSIQDYTSSNWITPPLHKEL